MRSCLALVGVGVLVLALAVGWLARDEIADFVSRAAHDGGSAGETMTAAEDMPASLARQVEAKVIALGQGELQEVNLDADQVSAWIGSMEGFVPPYVSDVSAVIEDERLVLFGRVVVREVPGAERLGPVATLFGDTASITVRGRLDGLQPGWGLLYVEVLQVGVVPLPEAMRDDLLDQLKGGVTDGLPRNAVPFQLPDFVTDVGVRGDSVFLRGLPSGR
jgi:hypothetical protein